MEKSTSKTSSRGSGDVGDSGKDDEQPTTSRQDNLIPEQTSHNMNDLKTLDFNSADEVRQAMKAVLAGNLPPQSFSKGSKHYTRNNSEPVKINELRNENPDQELQRTSPRPDKSQESHLKRTAPTDRCESSGLQKPGKSPKAGPSKTIRKLKYSSFYLGKLSNVVQFQRRWESETESDVDSVVTYY